MTTPADVARALYDSNRQTNVGILGVDDPASWGDLDSLAALLDALPPRVHCLEFSFCLGHSQEVTPVNVYRRLRLRLRQMEHTVAHHGSLVHDLQVRFYVTRRGTQATVETLRITPTAASPAFSTKFQQYMRRNQLVQHARVLAEPHRRENETDDAPVTQQQQQSTVVMSERERHAVWGRALVSLVQRREGQVTRSAIFTLLQKCPNFLVPHNS